MDTNFESWKDWFLGIEKAPEPPPEPIKIEPLYPQFSTQNLMISGALGLLTLGVGAWLMNKWDSKKTPNSEQLPVDKKKDGGPDDASDPYAGVVEVLQQQSLSSATSVKQQENPPLSPIASQNPSPASSRRGSDAGLDEQDGLDGDGVGKEQELEAPLLPSPSPSHNSSPAGSRRGSGAGVDQQDEMGASFTGLGEHSDLLLPFQGRDCRKCPDFVDHEHNPDDEKQDLCAPCDDDSVNGSDNFCTLAGGTIDRDAAYNGALVSGMKGKSHSHPTLMALAAANGGDVPRLPSPGSDDGQKKLLTYPQQ